MVGFWMRPAYREGFRDGSLTTLVRQGDRSKPEDTRHVPQGTPIPVRYIEKVGDPLRQVPTVLFPDDGTTVECVGVIVKSINELTEEDLEGSAPDNATPELVRYHLAMIANTDLPSWGSVVTVWKIRHLPNAEG